MSNQQFDEMVNNINNASSEDEKLRLLYSALFDANSTDFEREVLPAFGSQVLFVGKLSPISFGASHAFMRNIRLFGSTHILRNPFPSPYRGESDLSAIVKRALRYSESENSYCVFTVRRGQLKKENELFELKQLLLTIPPEAMDSSDTPELSLLEELGGELSEDAIWRIRLWHERPELFEQLESDWDNTEMVKKHLEDLQAELAENQREADRLEDAREQMGELCAGLKAHLDEKRQNVEKWRQEFYELCEKEDELAEEYKRRFPDVVASHDNATPFDSLHFDEFKSRLRYDYDSERVRQFLMSLRTSQVVLLCGKPGTGKTTFAREMSKALGARLTTIPVQNNWTDSSDLLGYYNPLDKTYYSTPFLDAVLAARDDWDPESPESARLHIICLDEMNLSRIEYYFATFLSLLQLDASERNLQLLPWMAVNELRHFRADGDGNTDSVPLYRYRDFVLPPNLRFVGTLNMDDSTQSLSPKVIDRSLFIEFERGGEAEERFGDLSHREERFYPVSLFEPDSEPEGGAGPSLTTEVEPYLNGRLRRYVREMWPTYNKLSEEGTSDGGAVPSATEFWDTVVLTKLLPSVDRSDAAEGLTKPFARSKERYEKGAERGRQIHPYDTDSWSFWE